MPSSTVTSSMEVEVLEVNIQLEPQSDFDHFTNSQNLKCQSPTGTELERISACIHELTSEKSQCSPGTPALCSRSEGITYRQLEEKSTLLSQRLILAGVVPGMLLPFCIEKSIIAVITMLAILKSGAVCVAIDPTHPKRRVQSIVDATNAKFVLTSQRHAQVFEDISNISVINVEHETAIDDTNSHTDSQANESSNGYTNGMSNGHISQSSSVLLSPESPAFVVFTSGSTGDPKGTILQHAAVCTSAHYHGLAMGIDANSRVFQYAPYTFDMSIYDIFTTLIRGGCVCIPSDEERFHDITGSVVDMGANWAFLPPSLVSLLDPEEMPCLRTLLVSAEPTSESVLRKWADKVRLINGYGSTECSTPLIATFSTTSDPGFIGAPHGARAWIVDRFDHNVLLPIEQVGELVLAGPVMAQGYLKNDIATREKFLDSTEWLPKEFVEQGLKVCKTGDLAQQSRDGTFKLCGRKGNMVKVRGQKVELGEVEEHILLNQDVKLCIAAFPKEGLYRDMLTAVYEPKFSEKESMGADGGGPEIEIIDNNNLETKGFRWQDLEIPLKQSLPKYMIPQKWIAVKTLPLLSSGKRDRSQVNAWLARQAHTQTPSHIPPYKNGYHSDPNLNGRPVFFCEVASLLKELTQGNFPLSDADNHITLSKAGVDSMRQISLNRKIKEKFGIAMDLSMLDKLDVIGISKFIQNSQGGKGHNTDIKTITPTQEYIRLRSKLQQEQVCFLRHRRRILLTGASGFLGIHILKELLESTPDTIIVCLVRSSSAKAGLQRLSDSATRANWPLLHLYHERVQVWPGDLSLPNLGLTPLQWSCVTGQSARYESIDSVIHNGAIVHWTRDYSSLAAANVDSTLSLLKAIGESPSCPSMIYVSGGQTWQYPEKNDIDVLADAESSSPPLSGYDLSKLVSELLVRKFARLSSSANKNKGTGRARNEVAILRPGYIIGSADNGIANTDDFLWRLVATNIQSKTYNGDESDAWLYITGADRVAEAVVDLFLQMNNENNHVVNGGLDGSCWIKNVVDGLRMSELWDIVGEGMKCEISAIDGAKWLGAVQAAAEEEKDSHPLWPLLDVTSGMEGRIGVERAERERVPVIVTRNVRSTIRKNLDFLREIGFLTVTSTTNQGQKESRMRTNGAFSRNIRI